MKMDKNVNLKPIKFKRATFTIYGKEGVPFYNDRLPEMTLETKPRPAKNTDEKFHQSYYLMEDGQYGFPASGIKKAIVRAGKFTPMDMVDLKSSVWVESDIGRLIEIKSADGKSIEPKVKTFTGKNKRGNAIPICYAQFDDWKMEIVVLFYESVVNLEGIANLLLIAGELIGLGPGRPEKGGSVLCGQFTLDEDLG